MADLTLRQCELVCKLFDEEGKPYITVEQVIEVVQKRKCIENYGFIIHDKDTVSVEEAKKNCELQVGALKAPHIHLIMKFNSPQHVKNVAKWFGVEQQFVSKLQNVWEPAVKYLVHRNAPQKYQYSLDEVNANFNVAEIVEAPSGGRKGMADAVIDKIICGEIKEFQRATIDPKIQVNYAVKIDRAFNVYNERCALEQKARATEVIFITGQSQSGKTTFAKHIAEERGLEYFVSSGNNDVLDGYRQEPCLILDEFRPECMTLSNALKLLDNNTACYVNRRYHNVYVNCDLIIITTTLSIEEFFEGLRNRDSEDIVQLKRRCGTLITMEMERIFIQRWNKTTKSYSTPVAYLNPVPEIVKSEEEAEEKNVEEFVNEMIPFLKRANSNKTETEFEKVPENEQLEIPFEQEEQK